MSPLGPERLRDREYLGTVQACKLNADYAAVSFEGKVNLHLVSLKNFQLQWLFSFAFFFDIKFPSSH